MVSEQGQRQERSQKLGEVIKLLWQRSLAEWPSVLEELSGEGGLVMENFYSIFTFQPVRKVQ